MLYGAHSYIFIDRWTDEALPILDRAKALKLDVLEIGVGDDVVINPAITRRHAEALEIELVISPGGDWPMTCDLSSENASERNMGIAWHERQIDLAADLGATAYAGAIYGHPGIIKKRRPHSDEYPWMAEGLHRLAEYAAERRIRLAIEPMSHFRTHLVNTPAQAMRLIEMTGHANLEMLFDTYHMTTEITDYAAGLRTAADRLWGIHACENNRGVPGRGIVPWGIVFQTLNELRFDGYIALESYNSSIGDFAFERGMFHNVCPDADAFVKEGMAFLRSGVRRPASGV